MATTSNRAERWGDPASENATMLNQHLLARHLFFSLFVVLFFLLLNRPEIILVSAGLGFTAWYPATGLSLAVMLCVSPRYFLLLAFADALAGAVIYHQPLLSWGETVGPIVAAGSYAGAAYLLRGPFRIDPTLRHRRDVVRYVSVTTVAALPATLVGVAFLVKDHTISLNQFWSSAVQWYMGDAVGLLGLAPFLLIHVFPWVQKQLLTLRADLNERPHLRTRDSGRRRLGDILEALGQIGAILFVLWFMFGRAFGSKEFYFLSFVPIIWIAMRHGIKRVASALLVFNFGIVVSLRLFPAPTDFQIKLGLLMLAVSGTGLIVGSEVTERRRVVRQLSERTGFLNSLIEHNPLGIVVQDHEGRVKFCNDAFTELFLYPREELVGRPLNPLICLPTSTAASSELAGALGSEQQNHRIVRRIRKDRNVRDVELHEVAIDLGSLRSASYTIYRDVSDQVKSAIEAKEYAESLDKLVTELQLRTMQLSLLNDMGDLLQGCANTEEAFAVISQSARKILSVSTGGALFLFKPPKAALQAAASWGLPLASEQEFPRVECWALRRGQSYWSEHPREGLICPHLKDPVAASYLCVPVVAHGETLGVVHVQYNRSESAKGTEAFESLQQSQQRLAAAVAGQVGLSLASLRLRETLQEQSIRDPLTGLFNRRFMEESLDRELLRATRKKRPLALVFLDLDHFKRFNDTFGHQAGDEVLRSVAEVLRMHYRAEDVICRYGGEEFAIILPESTTQEAARRSESLREAVKKIRIADGGRVLDTIRVSIGIAGYPEHASSAEDLLRIADAGLYQSKAKGRDRITVAGPIER